MSQYPQQTAQRSGLAITALIVGIVAFLTGWVPVLGLIIGIGAVVLGVIALTKKQSTGMSITGLILGVLAAITSIAFTIGLIMAAPAIIDEMEPPVAVQPEPEPEPAPEPEQEEPADEPQEPAGPTDTERSATLEQAIKDSFGGIESFTQLLAEDPTMWAGYIANVRVDGTRAYITLQVDRSTPDGKDLGERAAQALSTLLSKEDTQGIDWIIVEDATETVIDQKQPNPLH